MGEIAADGAAGLQPMLAAMRSDAAKRERITIVGIRISKGDAVLDCAPTTARPTSHLPPSIEIGERVSVNGFFANVVSCRGLVLDVKNLQALGGKQSKFLATQRKCADPKLPELRI